MTKYRVIKIVKEGCYIETSSELEAISIAESSDNDLNWFDIDSSIEVDD